MDDAVELEAQMNAIKKKMESNAEELNNLVQSLVDGANKTRELREKRNNSVSRKNSKKSVSDTKSSKHQNCLKDAPKPRAAHDFAIPVCYGSIELRDSLTIARKKLKEAIDVGNKAKQQLPTQYVEEVESMLKNFAILGDAFAQMMERMEMNVEDLSDDQPLG